MTTFLTEKRVTCRKRHRCVWCGQWIEPGEKATYRSGTHDGDFFSDYLHPECDDALGKSDLGSDDEFEFMGQIRGKTYEESHP